MNGVVQDVLENVSHEDRLQQTFMSQGWFVTRTLVGPGTWQPWQWSLYLPYRGGSTAQIVNYIAGIQPDGFFRTRATSSSEATNAAKVSELQLSSGQVVKWHGNHPPRLAPHVSDQPAILSPVTFTAGASDQDTGDTITGITWFIEDPSFSVAPNKADFNQCSLTPPGGTDPATGLPLVCPWRAFGDPGSGVSYTFGRPGTFGVLVMARDNNGAVSREQFNVVIGNLAPTLTVQTPVTTVAEGQDITIAGTVNFPALSPGFYSALTTVVVEWGDGAATRRGYPCTVNAQITPSDAQCQEIIGTNGVGWQTSQPAGPWPFSFTHKYVYSADSPLPDPTQIKVYATTNVGGRSQTEHFGVSVGNTPPTVLFALICRLFPGGQSSIACFPSFDKREVAIGQPLLIRGLIVDEPRANHFVKVKWGDGTSDALVSGCSDEGCPGHGVVFETTAAGKYMSLTHSYAQTGVYPITITVDDRGPSGVATYTTEAIIFGLIALTGPAEVAAGAAAAFNFTSVLPINSPAPTVTPTCPGGQVDRSDRIQLHVCVRRRRREDGCTGQAPGGHCGHDVRENAERRRSAAADDGVGHQRSDDGDGRDDGDLHLHREPLGVGILLIHAGLRLGRRHDRRASVARASPASSTTCRRRQTPT